MERGGGGEREKKRESHPQHRENIYSIFQNFEISKNRDETSSFRH